MTNKYDLNADDWRKLESNWTKVERPVEAALCKRAASIVSQKPVFVVLGSTMDEGISWGVIRNLGLECCLPVTSVKECKNLLRKQPYLIVRLDSWISVPDTLKTEVEDYISSETQWLDLEAALDLKSLIAFRKRYHLD